MSIKTEREQVEQLRKLFNTADKQAKTKRDDYLYLEEEDDYDYLEYKEECFEKISSYFWKIARKLSLSLDEYIDRDLSEEEGMKKVLLEYKERKPDWLLNVLEETEE